MAIKQEITSISGATAEYHRISEAHIDYTKRKANITVLSYLDSDKRDEEKTQASQDSERETIMKELDELVANPTEENKERRIELSNQINALQYQNPEELAPRNIFAEQYQIDLPADTDFTLEFAYGWLKENIYQEAEDC